MNVFRLILLLLPQIISFIKAAETAFPGPSAGKTKLDAVTDAVSSVAAAIPEIAQHAEALKAEVVPHVNALVAVFNALGILKRSSSSAPADSAPAPAAGAPA